MRNIKYIAACIFIFLFLFVVCDKDDSVSPETDTIADIDGTIYQIVKIGSQWWMAENLKVSRYSNGEAILNIVDNTEWDNTTDGAWAYYDNNQSHNTPYGKLYNGYAIRDQRGLCPAGWHIPGDAEWKQLEMHLGMSQEEAEKTGQRGTNEGGKLKSKQSEPASHPRWNNPNIGATNESGFSGLPGGQRDFNGFIDNGFYGWWWTSTDEGPGYNWCRALSFSDNKVSRGWTYATYGFSVRCVKD